MFNKIYGTVHNFLFGEERISGELSASEESLNDSAEAMQEYTTDAAPPRTEQGLTVCLDQTQVPGICEELNDSELISILYLVCDSPERAEELLQLGCTNGFGYSLNQWTLEDPTWRKKLIESLCIIQNYKVLKQLHYDKENLQRTLLVHHIHVANYIQAQRKALYYLCEQLDTTETAKLIELVRKEFQTEKHITLNNSSPLVELEAHLLQWEQHKYNFRHILAHLKALGLCDLQDKLDYAIKAPQHDTQKIRPELVQKSAPKSGKRVVDNDQLASISDTSSLGQDLSLVSNDRYFINPNNPGVCIIFNQEHFYMEIEEQYKDLLAPEPLSERMGTQKDYVRLQATFKEFGYRVVAHENRTHFDMLNIIKQEVAQIRDESSLFLIILSHGDRGIVYGVNSCKVPVSELQRIICTKNREHLRGKPKVLILQSCQGKYIQKLRLDDDVSDDDMTTDGPSSKQLVSDTSDLLTFWATVPGFAAIRDEKNGTWFIQSLCRKMCELGETEDFAYICTSVNNDISQKKWRDNAMTPCVHHSFRYKLFLPRRCNDNAQL